MGVIAALACTRAPESAQPRSADAERTRSTDELIDTRVPAGAAGDSGWRYQQRVSADLNGDGVAEQAVLISDVSLDGRGRPLWEDGHRWQVYVEDASGTRTRLYARFLPNGKLTASLTSVSDTTPPRILLLEQTRQSIGLHEIAYRGPGKAFIASSTVHELDIARPFSGSR
jgi:hypothetical protein